MRKERALKQVFNVLAAHKYAPNSRGFSAYSQSTDTKYYVGICNIPWCECPDYHKNKYNCKHASFILIKMSSMANHSYVLHQKALTNEELSIIFANADQVGPKI